MKIVFETLKFKNLLSYGNNLTTFEFQNGMDLVTGENGRGKSTVADGVTFALFGKPFRKIKLGSLVNNKNNKDLWVELTFTANTERFKIIRGQKPQIFEIHKEHKDGFVLLDQHSNVRDYQKFLEDNILNFNDNVFRQLIVLGANLSTSKPFMDLTAKEKEEVLQVITDTSIFNQLKELIREEKLLLKTKETEYKYKSTMVTSSLGSTRINIAAMEQQNAEFEYNRQTLLDQMENDIITTKKGIMDSEAMLKKMEEITTEQAGLNDELAPLNQELNDIKTIQGDIQHKAVVYKRNEDSKIICPHCDGEIKDHLHFDPEDLKKELAAATLKKEKLVEKIEPLQKRLEKIQSALTQKQRITYNLQTSKTELDALYKRKEETENWKSIEIDYLELKRLEKEEAEVKDVLIKTSSDLTDYSELEKLIGQDSLKGAILNQQLPILNKFINEFLEMFDSSYNFVIDNHLKDTVISRSTETEFNSLSNGQKQRITISILFAFLKLIEERNGVSTNLLILDEYLDSSLDVAGISEVLKILHEVFSPNKNIVLISHNPDIKSRIEYLNRNYNITLKDGFSDITVQKI